TLLRLIPQMFDGVKFEVSQLYLSDFRLPTSAFCPLPSAFPQPRSPKVAKNPYLVLSTFEVFRDRLAKLSFKSHQLPHRRSVDLR
ncbi:hypothetical protein, partial [Nostoc commune]|uniref:hypothetical protein n=1 Tax=Nostoc commune TaxID=1178 RepID=UPI001E5A9690